MKINKDLVAIKGYYFCRYGGATPLIMLLPLIVRSKGLSLQTVGLLWTVLPLVGLITNTISGTLADYFRAHRSVLLVSLISLTTGTVSLCFIPKLPFVAEASKEALSLASVANTTVGSSVFITNMSSLDLDLAGVDLGMTDEEGEAALWVLPPEEEALVVHGEDMSLASLIDYPQFWLIFFALMIEQMGLSTSVAIADAVCFQILGCARHLYGHQRLWGTVSMGLMSIVSGALVDIYSQGLPEKDYLPAIISCIIFTFANVLGVAMMKIPYSSDDRLKMGQVGKTLVQPQVLLFLMTVYVMGTSLGIVWVFKLMLVEDVALAWNPEFPVLKLLQGLVLGVETFFGELPFFFLSGMIIERLGYTPVLATSLLSLGLRCFLYYTVTNPWYFLPIELLNGPSFSIFYSVMASYTSHLAPPGAQSTLQSIVRSVFSVGLSTSGFLGGLFYTSWGGSIAFLQVGVFDVIYMLVFILLHFIIKRYCSYNDVTDETACSALQDSDKSDVFAKEALLVVNDLSIEKKCTEAARSVAGTHENTGNEYVKYII